MGADAEKKPRGHSGGSAIWSGFVVITAALAVILANGPASAPADAESDCVSEASAARVSSPSRYDANSLTAEEAAEFDRLLQAEAVLQKSPGAQSLRSVPVVFHVISDSNGTGNLAREVVNDQIQVLNKAYSGEFGGVDTKFRFRLKEITRTENSAWFTDFFAKEKAIKQQLRQGDAKTLNIYSISLSQGVLGRASFPQEYRKNPQGDGVVIDYRTVPGGSYQNFNLGHTATHETGHWLGLFHTFQNGCESPGDYVWDTPYEREQAIGCPEGRDTCPNRRGVDPVNNYMNYSNDPCLKEFTQGQAERMAMSWAAFRA